MNFNNECKEYQWEIVFTLEWYKTMWDGRIKRITVATRRIDLIGEDVQSIHDHTYSTRETEPLKGWIAKYAQGKHRPARNYQVGITDIIGTIKELNVTVLCCANARVFQHWFWMRDIGKLTVMRGTKTSLHLWPIMDCIDVPACHFFEEWPATFQKSDERSSSVLESLIGKTAIV